MLPPHNFSLATPRFPRVFPATSRFPRVFSCHTTLPSRVFPIRFPRVSPSSLCFPRITVLLATTQSDQRTTGPSSHVSRRQSHVSSQQDFRRRSLSPEHTRKPAVFGSKPNFQSSAGGRVYSACAVCLGRHPHKIVECAATRLWDNSHSSVATRSNKILTMLDGKSVCGDWQRHTGCPNSSHDHRHFCSGCASPSHGAQGCPRAQKITSSNPL
jgi:hypothetical protein